MHTGNRPTPHRLARSPKGPNAPHGPWRWSGAMTLAWVAACAATSVVTAAPAEAHGEEGVAEVLVAEVRDDGRLYVEVGVLYSNDEDLATDAAVTVTVTGAAGEQVGPEPLPRLEDARYAAALVPAGPGPWTVVVDSTRPSARVETTVAAPTPSTAPPTNAPGDAPTADTDAKADPDTADPDTADPDTVVPAGVVPTRVVPAGDGGDSTMVARLVVGTLATAAAAGCIVGGIWWGRRRSGTSGAGGRG